MLSFNRTMYRSAVGFELCSTAQKSSKILLYILKSFFLSDNRQSMKRWIVKRFILSDVAYSDECQAKKLLTMSKECCPFFIPTDYLNSSGCDTSRS